MKLKWKFMLLTSLLLTGLFLTSAVISSHFVSLAHRRTTDELSTQLIRSKASEGGSWLTQRVRELHTISRTPTVIAMDPATLRPYITQLSREMDALYGNDYGTFSVNNFDGLEYISEDQTIDVSDRAYFREMKTTAADWIISEPVVSKTDGSLITVACYAIYGDSGEKIGFVAASISLDQLTRITDQLAFYDGKSLILDGNGTRYTHDDGSLSPALLEAAAKHIPEGGSGQVSVVPLPEQARTIFYTAIPGSPDWHLVTLVETDRLYADTRVVSFSLAGIWLAILLAGILGSLLLSHLVTRRITALTEATERVAAGDLDTGLTVRGRDEISRLALSFNTMVVQMKGLMNRIQSDQQDKRKRELAILQAQINPHFIYNTLDTLQWKALAHGAEEVADLIQSLSTFFRISLSSGREFIPLGRELEHVRSYLEIQSQRYAEILTWQIHCDEDLTSLPVPKLIIQPLVENALYHGLKPKLTRGLIAITVSRQENDLLILVRDDGVGITAEKLSQLRVDLEAPVAGGSFGLFNVHQRIRLWDGLGHGLSIESTPDKGTAVRLKLAVKGDTDV